MSQTDYSPYRVQAWGLAASAPSAEEAAAVTDLARAQFPHADLAARAAVPLTDVRLPPPRIQPPPALAAVCTVDRRARCLHALGRGYVDLVRARNGDFAPAPDVVAVPRTADQVAAVLEWAAELGAACVPFGGGTSVVGGVNPPPDRPVITLQTRAMSRLLDVDGTSLAAHLEAGASGPVLEDHLRAHGMTLRFFPQSFELSTLGGWIATRAGGHFSTGPTHIDDAVEAISAVTPVGRWDSRRLPASGAGPSPDRLMLGSEGVLGVITDAWVRVQPRPRFRASTAVAFETFHTGAEAVRQLLQAGGTPAACRLLDPVEAALNGAGDGQHAVLVLGFESPHEPVEAAARRAMELCADAGGRPEQLRLAEGDDAGSGGGATHAWRRSFLRAPYLRDVLIGIGLIVETFETALLWSDFAEGHRRILDTTRDAVADVCGHGVVTTRTTHAYPDGVALYVTVIAPSRRGEEIRQWQQVKAAASDAVLAAGGTITHHHAVGRDHVPWYVRQGPTPLPAVLAAAKAAVDPVGLLNPGVLLPPAQVSDVADPGRSSTRR